MEFIITLDDIVLLFDNYSQDSQNLQASFERAGYHCKVMVIEDDGFLPEGVMSVYGYFLGEFQGKKGIPGKPRYFNQITVPDYWEISGTNSMGKVNDLYRERGKIFYAEPKHKRLVKVVDWYDENKVVRSSDHYNRYGALYARTTFNARGQKVNKSYFSAEGREIILENYVTGDIILNDGDEVKFFRTKTDFVVHVLVKAGLAQHRIFFNSLSTPFFVSQRLFSEAKRDVLFWQEPTGNEIPGNMKIILNGQASRTGQIMVQKRKSYDRLLELGASADIVRKLGFLYPFERENTCRPEALICTNSDRIEQCEKIVKALPQIHFHIAAITEMSSKLMAMESHDNVSLYPGVKMSVLDELFKKCDYYLDINHESEIVSAVYRAFLSKQVIFAFRETMHNENYVARAHIYRTEEADRMIADLQKAAGDEAALKDHLQMQLDEALSEEVERYWQFHLPGQPKA
jgi:accessory Sec system glycosyltransferase GtfB